MGARGSWLLLVVLAAACGDAVGGAEEPAHALTQTLSRSNVVDMPLGSAHGSLYSGAYLIESSRVDACVCRSGGCDPFSAQTGATALVTQLDGALRSVGDGSCTGGVDQDGRFWCGEAEESATGTIYGRQQGWFVLANGTPVSKEFTVDTTVVLTIRGQLYDCDLHATGSAHYVASNP
jgi:hypothetical protein